jgi:hypothetical protein
MKMNTTVWYSTSLLNNNNITLKNIELLYNYIELALSLICPSCIDLIKGCISKIKYTNLNEWKFECRIATLMFFKIYRINNELNKINKNDKKDKKKKMDELKIDIINNNNEKNCNLSLLELSNLIIKSLNNYNNFSNDYSSLIMNNGIIYFTTIQN